MMCRCIATTSTRQQHGGIIWHESAGKKTEEGPDKDTLLSTLWNSSPSRRHFAGKSWVGHVASPEDGCTTGKEGGHSKSSYPIESLAGGRRTWGRIGSAAGYVGKKIWGVRREHQSSGFIAIRQTEKGKKKGVKRKGALEL